MLWTLDLKAHERASTVDSRTQTQAWEGRQRVRSHHCRSGFSVFLAICLRKDTRGVLFCVLVNYCNNSSINSALLELP